jgi:hypothetical protein
MNFFDNKSILVLSVKFFNYENLIRDALITLGAKVDLFDERPSNSFYSKAIIRLKRDLYQRNIDKHYQNIISVIKNKKYDYFLLIKGEVVPVFFLEYLKSINPGIKLIYYTYDSFQNNPNGLSILPFFDKKFTFDREDSITYNLSFRPLFFASEYATVNEQVNQSFEYDLSFIGTAHSDRYSISQEISIWCEQFGFRMFNFYYSPSKILFNLKKLTDKNFVRFDRNKISFKSLTHKEINSIYKKSRAILDINHPGQNGLTMRSFETLGAGRKLITTNETIKSYPFYNASNIFVIDRQNVKLETDFFRGEFKKIDDDVYFSMSLEGWLMELFDKESTIWEK